MLQELKKRVSGTDADAAEDDGDSPSGALGDPRSAAALRRAALYGRVAMVRRCLHAAPSNVNIPDPRTGRTPLFEACAHDIDDPEADAIRPNQPNYITTVKLLANPDAASQDAVSFLNHVRYRGRTDHTIQSIERELLTPPCLEAIAYLNKCGAQFRLRAPASTLLKAALGACPGTRR